MTLTRMKFLNRVPQEHTKTLRYWLHQHYSGYETDRPFKNVHASEVTKDDGICPRLYALNDLTKKKPGQRWLSTAERLTYQMGRDQERNIVEAFADMGKSICHWRCINCSRLHPFQSRPFKCEECGAKVFKPEEVRFESDVTGISCGVDMLVALGEPKLRPVEIKTMASEEFKKLQAPLAEHRVRTTLYLRILSECKHSWASMVSHEQATILYIAKNAFGVADATLYKDEIKDKFSPFKEFTVKRNDELVEPLIKRAMVVKAYREGKVGIPAGVCSTALAQRAKRCSFCQECFSGDYPAEHIWEGSK